MKLKVWVDDMESLIDVAYLNKEECEDSGIKTATHVTISANGKFMLATKCMVGPDVSPRGWAGVQKPIADKLGLKHGDIVEVTVRPATNSLSCIRKKAEGKKLSAEEIDHVINDINDMQISNMEIASWVTALHTKGMDVSEMADMTRSMIKTSKVLDFGKKDVYDFHSIGGIPGNKITPIVVSIAAAAGLTIPKASTRAISSACGTVDFVELFCDPLLAPEEIVSVTKKTGGCLGWTGGLNISPSDENIIAVESLLGINPRAMLIASIMYEKMCVNSTHLLIDIPVGPETKIKTAEAARGYADDFVEVGKNLGVDVECVLTYGDVPIGNTIGPALEARECLQVLEDVNSSPNVAEKACEIAGVILEMAGMENGTQKAYEILRSGKALEKFRGIISAQKGNGNIKSEDIRPGKYVCEIKSHESGFVRGINNSAMVKIAKMAGSPQDKGAGILLKKNNGQKVGEGDVLFEIYADSESKCRHAANLANALSPFSTENIIIDRLS